MAEDAIKYAGVKLTVDGAQEFQKTLGEISSKMKLNTAELNKAKAGFDENTTAMEKLTTKHSDLTNKLKLNKDEQQALNEMLARAEAKYGENSKEVEALRTKLLQSETAQIRLTTALKNTTKEMKGQPWEEFGNKMKAAGEKMQAVGDKVSGIGKSLTLGLTVPLLAAGTGAFKLASDMQESTNKVDVAFGKSAQSIKDFSKETLTSFGIAKGTALDMASLFGDMGTGMKIPQDEAAKMSEKLVGLAGDLSSFKNISLDQSANALKGIFTGEGESLKSLGVIMNQTSLDAFAIANGFGKITKDMTEAEKVQLRYAFVLDSTKNAQGDFARTSEGAANQMKIATEGVKELASGFGELLLPVITPIIQNINKLVASLLSMDTGTQKTILVIAGIAAAIGPLLTIVGTFISTFGKITFAFGKLSAAIAKAGGLSAFLAQLGAAFLPVIATIAVVVAAGVLLYKNWDLVKAKAIELFNALKPTFDSIKTFFTTWVTEVTPIFIGAFEGIKNLVETVFNGLKLFWDTWGSTIISVFTVAFETVKNLVETVFNSIKSTFDSIKTFFTTWGTEITPIFTSAFDAIKEKATALFDALKPTFDSIKTFFTTWGKEIAPIFTDLFEAIKELAETVFDALKSFWDTWGKEVISTFTVAFEGIKKLVESVFNSIKSFWDTWGSTITTYFKMIWENIKTITATVFGLIKITVDTGLKIITQIIKIFSSALKGDWQAVWDGIKNTVSLAWSGIKSSVNVILEGIKGLFKNTVTGMISIGGDIMNGMIKGLQSKATAVKDTVLNMIKGFTTAIKEFFGIHSPSKLYEKEIGAMLPAGMAVGIDKNAKKAEAAAAKMAKDTYTASTLWIKDYQNSTKYLVSEELKMWGTLASKYSTISKEKLEIDKNIARLREVIIKETEAKEKATFDASKTWIEEKKKLGLLNMNEEIEAWERVQARYAVGTEKRREADISLFESQKRLFEEQEKITQKMADAEANYQKAVDDRTLSIYNSFGLFAELQKKEEVSSQTLTNNLRLQVIEMTNWADNMDKLAKRGIDQGLLDELRAMGVPANAEIAALVSMTDTELTAYAELWKEKHRIAKTEAVKQLVDLRASTNTEIKDLASDLSKLGKSDFKIAGENTTLGFIEGMKSKFDQLKQTATQMSKLVSDTISTQLKIHSPSRVLFEKGGFTGLGFILGLKSNSNQLKKTAIDMSKLVTDNLAIDENAMKLNAQSISNSLQTALPSLSNNVQQTVEQKTIAQRPLNLDITIGGNNFTIREEADIIKLAKTLKKQLFDEIKASGRIGGLGII